MQENHVTNHRCSGAISSSTAGVYIFHFIQPSVEGAQTQISHMAVSRVIEVSVAKG